MSLSRLSLVVWLLAAYLAWRVLPSLPLPAAIAYGLLLVATAAALPFALTARRIERQPLSDRLAWAGSLAMGLASTLLVLTLLRDGLLLVVGLGGALLAGPASGWPGVLAELTRGTAAAVPVLALLVTAWGFRNARRTAPVRPVDVPIADLPPALDGFTIVQLSDLHVGPTIKRRQIERIVAATNRLDADLIAITGDLVDGTVPALRDDVAPLAGLRSRHGTFFVTGNHEYYAGARAWIAELRRLGLRVLLNEHVVLRHDGASLLVAGVTDVSAGHFEPSQASDPQAALAGAPAGPMTKILLAHQPRSAPAAAAAGFDLQLSGHTHGGQFLPWNFFVRLQQPYTAGLHRLRTLWVYTSRGTGYWGPPVRVGAPSEITRLRLVAAAP